MASERKTVLFIVEGSSDKSALEKIFKSIYRNNKSIEFRFTNGDISSDPTTTKENLEEKIYAIVNDFIKDKKLKKTDIFQIVQIFDMDGAYIPDAAVITGKTGHFIYSTTNISSLDRGRILERNAHKRAIMDVLICTTYVKGIPYELYFMSCNLDHALYNEINLDKKLKQEYADEFYEKFIGKEYMFIKFLETDVVNGAPDTLTDSWNYIKKDLHSLERHTNLHIYFIQHPRPDGLL